MISHQSRVTIFLLAILVLVFGQTKPALSNESLPYRAKVIQVLDGTTIRLDTGRRVQLQSIRILSGREGEARQKLNEVVFQKEVTLQYEPKTPDRFGRAYAYVFLDDNKTMVNRLMVEAGVAEITQEPSNSYYRKKLLGLESEYSEGPFEDYERERMEERKELSKKMNYQFWIAWGSVIGAIVLGLSIRAWINHTRL